MSSAVRRAASDVQGLSRIQGTQFVQKAKGISQEKQLAAQRAATYRQQATLLSQTAAQERLATEQRARSAASEASLGQATLNRQRAQRVMADRGGTLPGKTAEESQQQMKILEDRQIAANRTLAAQNITMGSQNEIAEKRVMAAKAYQDVEEKNLELMRMQTAQMELAKKAEPTLLFQQRAQAVSHFGRVAQMSGLIAGAALGYAADKFAQFNTQATIAATKVKEPGQTVGQIKQNADQIQNSILGFMKSGQSVVGASDLSTSVYRTLSGLQLKGNQKQQITEAMNLVKQFQGVVKGNFGMTNLDQVTQAAITTMRDFGIGIKGVGGALNTMQAAEKYGRMTMGEFLSTFNQAAPAAKAAHYSFSEMASTIAFLSTKFPSVQMAATGYARLLQTLAQNADKFNKAGYQVTNKAGTQLLPLQDIIKSFLAKDPSLAQGGVGLQNFFKQVTGQSGYIQARRVFTFMATDLNGLDKVTKQVTGDTNVLQKTIAGAGQSSGVRWAQFKNQLAAIGLEIGQDALPAFQAVGHYVEEAVQKFNELSPATRKLIVEFTTFAALGALVGGTLAAIVGGLASFGAAIRLALGFGGLGAAMSGQEGFISLKFGLLAVIPLMIKFHSQVGSVVSDMGGMRNAIAIVSIALTAFSFRTVIMNLGLLRAATLSDITSLYVLRTALLGLAGLAVVATVLIVQRKQVEGAIRGVTGATLDKEINPVTGAAKAMSFGQKLGNIFGSSFSQGFHAAFSKEGLIRGDLGVTKVLSDAKSGVQRVSLAYKSWLSMLNRPGSPAALKAFLSMMQKAGLNSTSSALDFSQFLSNINRAASGTTGIRSLTKQLQALEKIMFEMARQNPLADLNNRASQAAAANIAKQKQVAAAAEAARKAQAKMLQNATTAGVVATKTYQQLYKALVAAQEAAAADPTSVSKQRAVVDAQAALDSQASKQQAAAAKAAASATTAAWKKSNADVAANSQETFKSILSSIQSMYDTMLSTEQGIFGTLFQGPFMQSPAMQNFTQWGGIATGKMLTKDLKSQVNQFRTFHSDLNKLTRKGAPPQLIKQLMDLGPSALPQIKALLQMSGAGLNNYFNIFRNAQKLIQKQTMQDLNAQLKQYRKFGQSVALAIVAGIQDQNASVTNALKSLIRQTFPNLKGSGGSGSGHQIHHHTHQHDHYHTSTHKGANADTQTRHQKFRAKSKHPRKKITGSRYDLG